jgi:hypothetical protein
MVHSLSREPRLPFVKVRVAFVDPLSICRNDSKYIISYVRLLLCYVPLRISNGFQLRETQTDAEIVFPPSHVTESCNSFLLPAVKSLNFVYDAVLRLNVISHFNYNHHQNCVSYLSLKMTTPLFLSSRYY